jgi:SAM-dependent methyltransferase
MSPVTFIDVLQFHQYFIDGRRKIGSKLQYWKDCRSLSARYKRFFFQKKGFEIGGPSNLFSSQGIIPVYSWANSVDNCNFSEKTMWDSKPADLTSSRGRQYIGDATDLSFIADQKYDFVISSHVIEHVANPTKAINEWKRILKDQGILLLICPHKEGTFDHLRQTTNLAHLINDFKKNIAEDDLSHLDEILSFHDLSMDPPAGTREQFCLRSKDNFHNRGLHHHVFNTELAIQLFDFLNIEILDVKTCLPYNIIICGRIDKKEIGIHEKNERFLSNDARWRKQSCFKEIFEGC